MPFLPTHVSPSTIASLQACGLAVLAYFCVYSIIKPLFVPTYVGETVGGMELKVAMAFAQTLGYGIGKIWAVYFYPGLGKAHWRNHLIGLVSGGFLCMLGVAVLPNWGRVLAIFISGLLLSPVWGIILRYLEGRQMTDAIFCVLNFSFIAAGGAMRSIGGYVLEWGVDSRWMPFLVGAVFIPVAIVGFVLLDRVPMPSKEDIAERSARQPATFSDQLAFLKRWWFGVGGVAIMYALVAAYRSFRDFFNPELWEALPGEFDPDVYASNEILIAFIVLLCLSMITFVRDSKRAFFLILMGFIFGGLLLIGVSTLCRDAGIISSFTWMTLIGIGLYIAYIPAGSLLYERLMAATGESLTVTFLAYLYDGIGYVGTTALLSYKTFSSTSDDSEVFLTLYLILSYLTAALGAGCVLVSATYFGLLLGRHRTGHHTLESPSFSVDEDDEPRLSPRSPSESELSRSVNNVASHTGPVVHHAGAAHLQLDQDSDVDDSKDTREPSSSFGGAGDSSSMGPSPSHSRLIDRNDTQGRSSRSRSPSNSEEDASRTFPASAKGIMSRKSAYRKLSHDPDDA